MALRNLVLLLLVSTLSFAGCGDDGGSIGGGNDAGSQIDANQSPLRCNFTNCDGCCDGDTCVDPTSDLSCGQAGSACQLCDNGDSCLAGSCTPATADCSDCTGCCLGGTQCLEGNTKAACGSDGTACVGCPDGQGCTGGTCSAIVCDNTNCPNGCCTANGECITNDQQSTAACGSAAQACNVCGPSAISCTLGTCVEDQPCLDFCTDGCCNASGQCILFAQQAAGVCGAAETCSACSGALSCIDGSCTADPVWQITVKSAVIAPLDPDGGEWDQTFFSNPLPDAYVGGSLVGDTFLDWFTATIDDTLTPNWNEAKDSYLESDLVGLGLLINIRDSDGLGVFESIGACNVTISANDLAAGTLTKATCGVSVTNLVLGFTQQ